MRNAPTKAQIIAAIRVMRERDALSQIIDAAEARDCHLANIESGDRRKRAWSRFSHLRKGDTVFIHKEPHGDSAIHWMYGQPLKVIEVKPRAKEIIAISHTGRRARLTALMALDLKLSEVPSAEAFANSLNPGGT